MPVSVSLKFHSSRANSRAIAQGRTPRSSVAYKATSALYANLGNALFARLYARLLIPRLGTLFIWLERCPSLVRILHCHGQFPPRFKRPRAHEYIRMALYFHEMRIFRPSGKDFDPTTV